MRTKKQFQIDAYQFQKLTRLMKIEDKSLRLVHLQAMIEDYMMDAKRENPRFDSQKFRDACTPKENAQC
jgi:hypothetical protein